MAFLGEGEGARGEVAGREGDFNCKVAGRFCGEIAGAEMEGDTKRVPCFTADRHVGWLGFAGTRVDEAMPFADTDSSKRCEVEVGARGMARSSEMEETGEVAGRERKADSVLETGEETVMERGERCRRR